MTISLSKEEFLERYVRRIKLLNIALDQDAQRLKPLIKVESTGETDIDLSTYQTQLILDTIERVVDLVYQDDF